MTARLRAVLELARAGNAAVTALAVWVGGSLGAEQFDVTAALKGALAAALVAAWGNAVNDLYDRHVDALEKPERPLPSGRLSVRGAWLWALSFAIVALSAGLWIGPRPLLIVALTLLLLWAYSRWLKRLPVIGNVSVSLVAGVAFLFGAVVQGEWVRTILPPGWVAFGFAFLWHLAREWVKTAQDHQSDGACGLRTLAVLYGPQTACRAAAWVLVVLLAGLFPPYFMGYFDLIYLLLVTVGVIPVLVGTIIYLWPGADPVRLGQLARLLKYDMLVGIGALWFGLR